MNESVRTLVIAVGVAWAALFLLALALTYLPRAVSKGGAGIWWGARAPWLDVIVAALTWIPWIIAGIAGGWAAVAGTMLGQVVALYSWIALHELVHRRGRGSARLVGYISRHYGRWRNHAALIVTLIGLPVLWPIRLTEIIAYPALIWLLGFPRYRHGDWVNISRQKFDGLIGHDLIWCLYCDWMTGVYALGGEMLRNVESFWCPIRFYDGKKCENCHIDFPDLDHGWVAADGSMQDVEALMRQKYPRGQQPAWFGHSVRLTVNEGSNGPGLQRGDA